MKTFKKAAIIALVISLCFYGTCFGGAGFYKYNIDDLARKAKKRIREIDEKIAQQERDKELAELSDKLQKLFEEAEALFNENKYEQADKIYREIERLSNDKDIKQLLEE